MTFRYTAVSIFIASRSNFKPLRVARKDSRKEKLRYKHCNTEGHIIETCFELIGYSERYNGKRYVRKNMGWLAHVVNLVSGDKANVSTWDTTFEALEDHLNNEKFDAILCKHYVSR